MLNRVLNQLREFILGDIVSTSPYSIYQDTIDYFHRKLSGKDYLPPWSLRNSVGPADDFERDGQDISQQLINLTDIMNKKYILDVGCGCGRVALYLARDGYKGIYWGMDIVDRQITWAQHNISKKYPNFYFYKADLNNKLYNPSGKLKTENYKFPFSDGSFDLIFHASLFTHLIPRDTLQLIKEASRLLKKGSLAFMTFFLLNRTQERLKNESAIQFRFGNSIYKTNLKNLLESAIAYDETYIIKILKQNGLSITGPILYGSWSGRKEYTSFQDIVLVVKN